MKGVTEQADEAFIQSFFDQSGAVSGYDERQTAQLDRALKTAIEQKQTASAQGWKDSLPFLLLFIFLYAALGASLTLDLSAGNPAHGHKSIEYALEAIPVLIAFSGYIVAILYIFHCKTSANRIKNWEQAILILERQASGHLFNAVNTNCAGTTDYCGSRINTTLALYIGLTWLVMYNYITFTTSGVMGSVISLFISTMAYVILDIQLLRSSVNPAPPAEDTEDNNENEKK